MSSANPVGMRPSIEAVQRRLGLVGCEHDWRLHGRVKRGSKGVLGHHRRTGFHITSQCHKCGELKHDPVSADLVLERDLRREVG